MIFENKELLLPGSVSINNYLSFLINYIDNELPEDKKAEVEEFLKKNPPAKKEFDILLKTKLQPDTSIVFPDKSLLYRKPEKVKVISMIWMRVAVAAVLLLISGYFLLRNTSGNVGNDPEIAQVNDSAPNTEQVTTFDDKNKEQKLPVDPNKITSDQTLADASVNTNNNHAKEITNENTIQIKKIKEDNNIEPVFAEIDLTTLTGAETTHLPKRIRNTQSFSTEEEERKSGFFNDISVTDKTTPTYAIYTPLEESDDTGGFKEFLRKATRVFERRTKIQTTTEDNKLLLGAFAVSLK